jgi:hypothetical protein
MKIKYLTKVTLQEWERKANVTISIEELESNQLYDNRLKYGVSIEEYTYVKDNRHSCIMGSVYDLGYTVQDALQRLVDKISGKVLTDGKGNYLEVPHLEVGNNTQENKPVYRKTRSVGVSSIIENDHWRSLSPFSLTPYHASTPHDRTYGGILWGMDVGKYKN